MDGKRDGVRTSTTEIFCWDFQLVTLRASVFFRGALLPTLVPTSINQAYRTGTPATAKQVEKRAGNIYVGSGNNRHVRRGKENST
jgi:hypothetical protein